MKTLLKKVRGDKKGFTLAELLVVVAIIGILVAVSVPIFTAQLGKARVATNNANLRAAKAAAIAQYLTTDDTAKSTGATYEYTVADGTIKTGTISTGNNATDKEVEINATTGDTAVASDKTYATIKVQISATDAALTDASVKLYVAK